MLVKRTVNVTQECIDNGKRNQCAHCPVALAVNQTFPELRGEGRVTYTSVYGGNYDCALPTHIKFEILNFDRSGKMDPFSFEVALDLD